MGTHWKQQKNKKISCGRLYTFDQSFCQEWHRNAFWPPFYGKLPIGNRSYAILDSGFVTSNTLPWVLQTLAGWQLIPCPIAHHKRKTVKENEQHNVSECLQFHSLREREGRSEQPECTKTQVHLWLLLSMPKHPLCPSQKPQRYDKVCRIPVHREENVAANIVLAQKECAETTCTFIGKILLCCRNRKRGFYLVGSWDLHNFHFFVEGLTF